MRKGAAFFKTLWECDIENVIAENPIMLGYAKELIGCGDQTQTVQPWMWGDPFQKATCLWMRGKFKKLIPLFPTWEHLRIHLGLPEDAKPKQKVHPAAPGPDRWKLRSLTEPGIARALAQQGAAHVLASD